MNWATLSAAATQGSIAREGVLWKQGVLAMPKIVGQTIGAVQEILEKLAAVELMLAQKPIISGRFSGILPFVKHNPWQLVSKNEVFFEHMHILNGLIKNVWPLQFLVLKIYSIGCKMLHLKSVCLHRLAKSCETVTGHWSCCMEFSTCLL